MKKIVKIMVIALLISLTSTSTYQVKANELTNNVIEQFEALVIKTKQYKEFESRIIRTEVKTIANTQQGERITISYLVDNEDNRLVFVGDSELNFLFIGYLTYTPNQTKLTEYLDDRVTTMNVPPHATYC